jgi:hypothetical protein
MLKTSSDGVWLESRTTQQHRNRGTLGLFDPDHKQSNALVGPVAERTAATDPKHPSAPMATMTTDDRCQPCVPGSKADDRPLPRANAPWYAHGYGCSGGLAFTYRRMHHGDADADTTCAASRGWRATSVERAGET